MRLSESQEEMVTPTRPDGRHIDYALHTAGITCSGRDMADADAKISDHNLVWYDFQLGWNEQTLKIRPGALLAPSQDVDISDALWHEAWYVAAGDAESAWHMLSDCVEKLLMLDAGTSGRKRWDISPPQASRLVSTHARGNCSAKMAGLLRLRRQRVQIQLGTVD